MKFRFFLFILFLSLANAFASDLDFTLVNQTARSFEGLYITASDNKDWDANLLLNGKVLAAGGKFQVLQERRKIRNLGFQPGGRRGTFSDLR